MIQHAPAPQVAGSPSVSPVAAQSPPIAPPTGGVLAPKVLSVFPLSGPPGSKVTVVGTGFVQVRKVMFGAVTSASVKVFLPRNLRPLFLPALLALTTAVAAELDGTSVIVNAVDPGLTATWPGAEAMGARPVADSVPGIVWAATLPDDGPRGGFFRDEQPHPW
jgi:hypothetical protein